MNTHTQILPPATSRLPQQFLAFSLITYLFHTSAKHSRSGQAHQRPRNQWALSNSQWVWCCDLWSKRGAICFFPSVSISLLLICVCFFTGSFTPCPNIRTQKSRQRLLFHHSRNPICVALNNEHHTPQGIFPSSCSTSTFITTPVITPFNGTLFLRARQFTFLAPIC
jgi:hypothetical protein